MLDSSPSAIKQTIFEARTSLGECDEGREMRLRRGPARLLSDGDGRVLRGRRVRAHLRSCRGCRRFKVALAQRRPTSPCSRRRSPRLPAPPCSRPSPAGRRRPVQGGGAGAGGTALAGKIVAVVTATAVAAGGTVAATDAVRGSSHETDRAPRHAASPTHRSSPPGRSGQSLPVRARRQPAGRGALDRPARRKHRPNRRRETAAGAASSPSHVSRPERSRGGGRPDRPAPPAGQAKTPARRAVGRTRPQPPKSQGKAKGHEKEPNGPKPVKTPKPATAEQPPQASNGNGNGKK